MSPARLLGGDDGTAGDWWAVGVTMLEIMAAAPQCSGSGSARSSAESAGAPCGATESERESAGGGDSGGISGAATVDGAAAEDACVDCCSWPFRPRDVSAAALSALGLHSADQLPCSAAVLLAWLEAVYAADIVWPRAVTPAARHAVEGLLRPHACTRWGLEELLGSGMLCEADFDAVANKHPKLADDMQVGRQGKTRRTDTPTHTDNHHLEQCPPCFVG